MSSQRAADSPLPTFSTTTRTATWHAPNGLVHNQIDLILTLQNLMLTTIKLKLKTKRFMRSSPNQFDLERLKHQKIAVVFKAKVCGKFTALRILDNDVDTLANSLKEAPLSIT